MLEKERFIRCYKRLAQAIQNDNLDKFCFNQDELIIPSEFKYYEDYVYTVMRRIKEFVRFIKFCREQGFDRASLAGANINFGVKSIDKTNLVSLTQTEYYKNFAHSHYIDSWWVGGLRCSRPFSCYDRGSGGVQSTEDARNKLHDLSTISRANYIFKYEKDAVFAPVAAIAILLLCIILKEKNVVGGAPTMITGVFSLPIIILGIPYIIKKFLESTEEIKSRIEFNRDAQRNSEAVEEFLSKVEKPFEPVTDKEIKQILDEVTITAKPRSLVSKAIDIKDDFVESLIFRYS